MLFTKRQVMYVSRATARAMSAEMPIGDPYGGPAYGQKEDWGTAISVGGSLLGGVLSDNASSDAANTQAGAANSAAQLENMAAQRALEEQKRQFDLSRSDLTPWRETGTAALGRLSQMSGLSIPKTYSDADILSAANAEQRGQLDTFDSQISRLNSILNGPIKPDWSSPGGATPMPAIAGYRQALDTAQRGRSQITSGIKGTLTSNASATPAAPYQFSSDDPSYAFRQSEGNKSIEAALRARGMYGSGGALKELTDYNSNLASTEFGNQFGRLSTLAGYGQNATNSGNTLGAQYAANAGNIGMNSAANSGNALLAGANARASGYVNSANNWGNTLGNIGGTLADYYKRNGSGGSGSESYPWNYNW